jgi:hypothetical protein
VGFEVLISVIIKSSLFWDITPCNQLKVKQRFREIYRIYLQGRKITQRELVTKQSSKKEKMVEKRGHACGQKRSAYSFVIGTKCRGYTAFEY